METIKLKILAFFGCHFRQAMDITVKEAILFPLLSLHIHLVSFIISVNLETGSHEMCHNLIVYLSLIGTTVEYLIIINLIGSNSLSAVNLSTDPYDKLATVRICTF
jgi:hypothetical protein